MISMYTEKKAEQHSLIHSSDLVVLFYFIFFARKKNTKGLDTGISGRIMLRSIKPTLNSQGFLDPSFFHTLIE